MSDDVFAFRDGEEPQNIELEAYKCAASHSWRMAALTAGSSDPADLAYRRYLMKRVVLFAERAAALGDTGVLTIVLPGARKYLLSENAMKTTPELPDGARDNPWRNKDIERGRATDFRPAAGQPKVDEPFDFDTLPPSEE